MSRELAVLLTADGTGCLFFAGCRAARVVGHLLAADIAVVVVVCICVRRYIFLISADGALMPMVCLVGRPLGLVVVSRELAVLLTADGTGCFFLAGCRAACVVGHLLAADIAIVVVICIYVRRQVLFISAGALVPMVCTVCRPLCAVGMCMRLILPDCI